MFIKRTLLLSLFVLLAISNKHSVINQRKETATDTTHTNVSLTDKAADVNISISGGFFVSYQFPKRFNPYSAVGNKIQIFAIEDQNRQLSAGRYVLQLNYHVAGITSDSADQIELCTYNTAPADDNLCQLIDNPGKKISTDKWMYFYCNYDFNRKDAKVFVFFEDNSHIELTIENLTHIPFGNLVQMNLNSADGKNGLNGYYNDVNFWINEEIHIDADKVKEFRKTSYTDPEYDKSDEQCSTMIPNYIQRTSVSDPFNQVSIQNTNFNREFSIAFTYETSQTPDKDIIAQCTFKPLSEIKLSEKHYGDFLFHMEQTGNELLFTFYQNWNFHLADHLSVQTPSQKLTVALDYHDVNNPIYVYLGFDYLNNKINILVKGYTSTHQEVIPDSIYRNMYDMTMYFGNFYDTSTPGESGSITKFGQMQFCQGVGSVKTSIETYQQITTWHNANIQTEICSLSKKFILDGFLETPPVCEIAKNLDEKTIYQCQIQTKYIWRSCFDLTMFMQNGDCKTSDKIEYKTSETDKGTLISLEIEESIIQTYKFIESYDKISKIYLMELKLQDRNADKTMNILLLQMVEKVDTKQGIKTLKLQTDFTWQNKNVYTFNQLKLVPFLDNVEKKQGDEEIKDGNFHFQINDETNLKIRLEHTDSTFIQGRYLQIIGYSLLDQEQKIIYTADRDIMGNNLFVEWQIDWALIRHELRQKKIDFTGFRIFQVKYLSLPQTDPTLFQHVCSYLPLENNSQFKVTMGTSFAAILQFSVGILLIISLLI